MITWFKNWLGWINCSNCEACDWKQQAWSNVCNQCGTWSKHNE